MSSRLTFRGDHTPFLRPRKSPIKRFGDPSPLASLGRDDKDRNKKAPDRKIRGFKMRVKSGSSGRTRTADKVVNSHLLYRLSY